LGRGYLSSQLVAGKLATEMRMVKINGFRPGLDQQLVLIFGFWVPFFSIRKLSVMVLNFDGIFEVPYPPDDFKIQTKKVPRQQE
jgi:hypothetical protein